jgi:hypothetical protein
MKVNYIDENENIVTKEIKINFDNVSETDFQKAFEGCTSLDSGKFVLENIQKYSLSEIQEMLRNCKDISN